MNVLPFEITHQFSTTVCFYKIRDVRFEGTFLGCHFTVVSSYAGMLLHPSTHQKESLLPAPVRFPCSTGMELVLHINTFNINLTLQPQVKTKQVTTEMH